MKSFLVALLLVFNCAPASALDPRQVEQVLALAKGGSAEAQYHVGMMFNNGIYGAAKDPLQAFEWFTKSAAGNDPLGAYKAGCYYDGQFPGTVAVDGTKALQYKLLAARAGYSLAQYDVGAAYYRAGNFVEAGNWWKLAADQGLASAVYALSTWHYEGKAGAKNLPMAYAFFKLSQLLARGQVTANAREALDKIAKEMAPEDLANAEQFVATWVATPTELTLDARRASARIEALLKAGSPPSN